MFVQQDQIPRSPVASTVTAFVHGCMGVVVWAVSTTSAVSEVPAARERLTHVMMLAPPPVVIEAPRPAPARLLEPEPALDRALPVIEPRVVDRTEPDRVEKRVEEIPRERPAPPEAAPPRIRLGAFGDAAPHPDQKKPAPAVQATGFDQTVSRASASRLVAVTELGAFAADAAPPSAPARPLVTASAGFGGDAVAVSARSAAPLKTETGFGAAAAPAARHVPHATGEAHFGVEPAGAARGAAPRELATSGFAEPVPARTAAQRHAAQPVNRAVEVTYKPQPQYTEEARQLRIEGEVQLEVEFTATGVVRVLRVARGLGHGLDDMAIRAVQQIRFNPALRDGVPVTSRTHVNIVFRLT